VGDDVRTTRVTLNFTVDRSQTVAQLCGKPQNWQPSGLSGVGLLEQQSIVSVC